MLLGRSETALLYSQHGLLSTNDSTHKTCARESCFCTLTCLLYLVLFVCCSIPLLSTCITLIEIPVRPLFPSSFLSAKNNLRSFFCVWCSFIMFHACIALMESLFTFAFLLPYFIAWIELCVHFFFSLLCLILWYQWNSQLFSLILSRLHRVCQCCRLLLVQGPRTLQVILNSFSLQVFPTFSRK